LREELCKLVLEFGLLTKLDDVSRVEIENIANFEEIS
jgi:hypothetical protein